MSSIKLMGSVWAECEGCGDRSRQVYYYQEPERNRVLCVCGGTLLMEPDRHRTHNVFPHVNPHLTGEGPVAVESLSHLRKLEKQYGVVVHAFSQDSVDSPGQLPDFRPKGRHWRDQ